MNRTSASCEERRTRVETARRSKICPSCNPRAASRLDSRGEEPYLPVVGIRPARRIDPALRLGEIAARLGEQRELLERCDCPRLERAGAERGVARRRRSTVRSGPSALRQRMPGEERNQLEHHDDEGEPRERRAHAQTTAAAPARGQVGRGRSQAPRRRRARPREAARASRSRRRPRRRPRPRWPRRPRPAARRPCVGRCERRSRSRRPRPRRRGGSPRLLARRGSRGRANAHCERTSSRIRARPTRRRTSPPRRRLPALTATRRQQQSRIASGRCRCR